MDPETNMELGRRHPEKLRVKVIEVEDRYSRAATYRRVSNLQMTGLASVLGASRERIAADATRPVKIVTVDIGDTARELPGVSEED